MAENDVSPILGFENYVIDTYGNVINITTGKTLATSKNKGGYVSVRLCKKENSHKIHKRFLLHRLMLVTFKGVDPDPKKNMLIT